jgi:hypothetical protein
MKLSELLNMTNMGVYTSFCDYNCDYNNLLTEVLILNPSSDTLI